MQVELSPRDSIVRSLRLWWVLLIAIILGGLAGYTFHRFHPPIYQAKAIISTFIDFQALHDVRLSEYDEDITINSVKSVLLSNEVIGTVIMEAGKDGIPLDYPTFMENMDLYRELSNFDLFYRDRDPAIAQKIVNMWLNAGMESIHRLQADGRLPAFLTISLGSTAELPQKPYFSQTNSYVFAGLILGGIIGLLLSSTQPIQMVKPHKKVSARKPRRQD